MASVRVTADPLVPSKYTHCFPSSVTKLGVPEALPYVDELVRSPLSKLRFISSPLSGITGASVGSGAAVGIRQ